MYLTEYDPILGKKQKTYFFEYDLVLRCALAHECDTIIQLLLIEIFTILIINFWCINNWVHKNY